MTRKEKRMINVMRNPLGLKKRMNEALLKSRWVYIQLFQLRLSPSKAEKSNTSAKSLLGVTIKNT